MVACVGRYPMAQGPWGLKKDDMGYLRDRRIGIEVLVCLGSKLRRWSVKDTRGASRGLRCIHEIRSDRRRPCGGVATWVNSL